MWPSKVYLRVLLQGIYKEDINEPLHAAKSLCVMQVKFLDSPAPIGAMYRIYTLGMSIQHLSTCM